MLAGRTTDERIDIAHERLMKNKLSVETILSMEESTLANLLEGVTSGAQKAKWIQKATKTISEKYGGDVPKTKEELIAFSGIGEKIATITLRYCWGINSGIAVDTHIHRVCNRLGWVKTKEPNDTKKVLEGLVPDDMWVDIGSLYHFGQDTCTALSPKCQTCPVKSDCPSCKI